SSIVTSPPTPGWPRASAAPVRRLPEIPVSRDGEVQPAIPQRIRAREEADVRARGQLRHRGERDLGPAEAAETDGRSIAIDYSTAVVVEIAVGKAPIGHAGSPVGRERHHVADRFRIADPHEYARGDGGHRISLVADERGIGFEPELPLRPQPERRRE